MIDWEKSAKLNNMSVDDLKMWFDKYPSSGRRIIAICEGLNCKNKNKGREITFHGYTSLCKSCVNVESWKDENIRDKRIKNITISTIKRWSNPDERKKASDYWMGRRTGKDNSTYGVKCTDEKKDKIRNSMPDMSGDKSVHYKSEIDI